MIRQFLRGIDTAAAAREARRLLFIAAIACAAFARAKDVDPAVLAPDATVFYLAIDDVTKMEADWKKTNLYTLWSDPQMQKYTKPLRDRFLPESQPSAKGERPSPEGETGKPAPDDILAKIAKLAWPDFKELFPGGFCVFVSDVDFLPPYGNGPADVCVAGKAGKPDRKAYDPIVDILNWTPTASPERKTFKVGDVTVYQTRAANPDFNSQSAPQGTVMPESIERMKYCTIQTAMVDGWILIADGSEKTLRQMILRHTDKRGDSLKRSPNFRAAMERADKSAHIRFYANLDPITNGLASTFKQSASAFDLAALHLDDFKAAGYSAVFGPAGIRQRMKLVMAPAPAGAGRLLDGFRAPCQLKTARLAPEEVLSYEGISFDVEKFYNALRDVIRAVSPAKDAEWDRRLADMRQTLGFDPVTEIIQTLGGELALIYPKPGGSAAASPVPGLATQLVLALECRDGKRLKTAFEKSEKALLKDMTPQNATAPESPFDKTAYLGVDIYTIKSQPQPGGGMMPAPSFAWAFTDSWAFLATSSDLLKETLRRAGGRETRSFADTPRFRKTRDLFQGPVTGMSVSDTAAQMDMLAQSAGMIAAMVSLSSGGRISPNWLDFAAKPDRALFERTLGPTVSAMTSGPDGIAMNWILQNP